MVPVLSLFLFLVLIRFTWLNSCSISVLLCRTVNNPSTSSLTFWISCLFNETSFIHLHHSPVLIYVVSVCIRYRLKSDSNKNVSSIYHLFRPLTAVVEISLPVLQLDHGYPCFCMGLGQNEMKCRCFRPLFCTMKAELGRGQLGLMR